MSDPGPTVVHDRLGLAAELRALSSARSVGPREVQRRSEKLLDEEKTVRASRRRPAEQPGQSRFVALPRSTVSDFLRTGDLSFPQFDTFLMVCGVTDEERRTWLAAWERVTDPAPATTVVNAIPGEAACFQQRAAVSTLHRPGRLRGGHYVITGLGGVGKTQIAASFAASMARSRGAYLVAWSLAASRDAIIGTYALAAQSLNLPGAGDGDERACAAFLSWCASTTRPWVVVLDDLADAAAVRDLWPPVSPTGQVLVTTRRRDVTLLEGRILVPVDVFRPDEARNYLAARLPSAADDLDGVARDLGFLPLALNHASAYMLQTDTTCTAYRRRFADTRRRLRQLFPDARQSFDAHAETVATTWAISIRHADGFDPTGVAAPLLDVASFLDPSAIPAAVFTAPGVLRLLARHSQVDADRPGAVDDATQGRSNLRLFNLIDEESNTVRTHSLVQRAVRERLTSDEADLTARAAADALLECWPEVENDATTAATLRANAAALREHRGSALTTEAIHPVLLRAVESLADVGQHRAALETTSALLDDARTRLGANHRDVLRLRNSYADLHGQTGRPAEAVALLDALIPDMRYALGDDDRGTLATRYNRAHWLGQAGRLGEAVAAAEDLLADRLRLLGPDARDTMTSRDQVTRWKGAAGDVGGALEEARTLLADQLRILGPDHMDTLTTRNNLATWLGESGDAAGAAAEFAQLVVDRKRVLGPDHHHTLFARNNALHWQGLAGDAAGTAAGYVGFLGDMERILGPQHVNTLATRGNLARWRAEAGDLSGAIEASEQLREDQAHVLGPDQPHVLVTRHNIATWRGESGDVAGAVAELAEVLDDRVRVLGPDHPDTLHTRGYLAWWRAEGGEVREVVKDLEAVLADQRRILSEDHPTTLTTRFRLAVVRGRAGAPDVAAADLEELVPDLERVLGPRHGLVAAARREAATWRRS